MSSHPRRCAVCNRETEYACGRCRNEWYCSARCQKLDAKRHIAAGCREPSVGVTFGPTDFACSKHLATLRDKDSGALTIWVGDLLKWEHIARIGEGSTGRVEMYRFTGDEGRQIAIKFENPDKEKCVTSATLREMVLRNMQHPNVVSICGVGAAPRPAGKETKIDTTPCVFLTMDKAACSMVDLNEKLNDAKEQDTPFDEFMVLAYQIVLAVAYLHAHAVVVGDIKLDNILVGEYQQDSNNGLAIARPLLADLGSSHRAYTIEQKSFNGTPGYLAPELFMQETDQVDPSMASDMWALGMTLYSIASGDTVSIPEEEVEQDVAMYTKMVQILGNPTGDDEAYLANLGKGKSLQRTHAAKAATTTTAKQRRKKKPTTEEEEEEVHSIAVGTAKYPGLENFLRKILRFRPEDRATAAELLFDDFFTGKKLSDLPIVGKKGLYGSPPEGSVSVRDFVTKYVSADVLSFSPARFSPGDKLTPDPEWMVHAMMREERAIDIPRLHQQPLIQQDMNKERATYQNIVLELVNIAIQDTLSTPVTLEILFKAIDITLAAMHRQQLSTIKSKDLFLVLYTMAKKCTYRTIFEDKFTTYKKGKQNIANVRMGKIRALELQLLEWTDCDLLGPTPYDFLRYYAKMANVSGDDYNLALAILLLVCTDCEFLDGRCPSGVASLVMQLAIGDVQYTAMEDKGLVLGMLDKEPLEKIIGMWASAQTGDSILQSLAISTGKNAIFTDIFSQFEATEKLIPPAKLREQESESAAI